MKIVRNNLVKILFFLTAAVSYSACCTNLAKENSNVPVKGNRNLNPTSVGINKSFVSAKVENIYSNDDGILKVKALITKVKESPAYPSLAMQGSEYILIPNFQVDENKTLVTDSDKNQKLQLLLKQSKGYEFKAIIFFENPNSWFIEDIINN
jgi:hypothetical protein